MRRGKMVGTGELVGRIYEAPVDPDAWPSVLDDIGRSVDAAASLLLVARNDRWFGWRCSPHTPTGISDYLHSDGPSRSQITSRLVQVNQAGFVPDQDVLPQDAWLADPLMAEFATPAGFHRAAATAIHVPNGDLVVVHLHRRTGLPAFDSSDLNRLNALRPHLARAVMLAARWRLEKLRAATEALELVGLPAAVVDVGCRALYANDLIQRQCPWIAWLPGNRVALADRTASDMLQRAVAEAGDPLAPSVRSIAVRSTIATVAAVVHVLPAAGQVREIFGGGLAIIMITPAASGAKLADGVLRALFDLTPSEAKVARGIAEGASLEAMAAAHLVSVGTIRAQTKAVFAKTGTHRQAQVAALLAGLGRVPTAGSS